MKQSEWESEKDLPSAGSSHFSNDSNSQSWAEQKAETWKPIRDIHKGGGGPNTGAITWCHPGISTETGLEE